MYIIINFVLIEPQLHLVLKVVVPKVAAHWVTVAHNLQFDVSRVKIIEQKCRDDPEKCAYELFTYWLQSSEGIGPTAVCSKFSSFYSNFSKKYNMLIILSLFSKLFHFFFTFVVARL